MQLKLITPTEKLFEGAVDSITLPGKAGQLTVLPGHTFLLTPLAAGKIVYRTALGANTIQMNSGLAEVQGDVVTVTVVSSGSRWVSSL